MCKSSSTSTVIIQCYELDCSCVLHTVFISENQCPLMPEAFRSGIMSPPRVHRWTSWKPRFRSFTDHHVTQMPCLSRTYSCAAVFRSATGSLPHVLCNEFLVDCRLEKTRVTVFLHEGVNLTLGEVEAGGCGLLHILQGHGSGFMIKVNLSWCVRADKLLINFLGLCAQFWRALCVPEVLAGQIESDIFFTVFRWQECCESAQPVFVKQQFVKRLSVLQ